MNRLLSLLVIVLGVVCLAVGVLFIYQGFSKNNYLVTNIKQEKITLGLTQEQIAAGQVDVTADQLQKASEQIRGDRHSIAPTYSDLLGGKRFNPADPKQASWAQGLNLESSLNLAVLSYGVVQVVEGVGAFMIIVAIALGAIGIVLWRMSAKHPPA
jgi:hypothetical protein